MKTLYNLPEDWDKVAAVFSALGDLTRQKIIMLFEPEEELSIKDIAGQFDLGRTTIVHHLAVLHNSGVLAMRRKGRQTLYSVVYNDMLEAMQKMQLYLENHIWSSVGAKARTSAGISTPSPSGYMYDMDMDLPDRTELLFVKDDEEELDFAMRHSQSRVDFYKKL